MARQQKDDTTREGERSGEEDREGLSKSAQRAKWIHSVGEHEDRPGQTLATRNHEVIRLWAQVRGGKPATVSGTEHDDRAGVLRFNFPGFDESDRVQEIAWEEWFRPFDERNLVFLYQEHKTNGATSTFFRLDSPEREDA